MIKTLTVLLTLFPLIESMLIDNYLRLRGDDRRVDNQGLSRASLAQCDRCCLWGFLIPNLVILAVALVHPSWPQNTGKELVFYASFLGLFLSVGLAILYKRRSYSGFTSRKHSAMIA